MQKFVTWVEIPAVDFDKAVNFYNFVFKLNLLKQDFGSEKMACLPNDEGTPKHYFDHYESYSDFFE